eukprot:TRINITY_DN11353_c1_g1_i1.p1 TRINITY_DN11353_c1_g1~~TRINITY_DN11353_c1_g1_i1.p1  ORF type:complete len:379 (+),score=58.74 TRINITY_DN11353_c1_g1_i1:1212-2348(+)
MKRTRFLYCPALRLKTGELSGVRELAADVAGCTLPRFIVPPAAERDENQMQLFTSDNVPDLTIISRHWHGRPVLIDATYLLDECGRDRTLEWLPQMFSRARNYGVRAIPMAALNDIGDAEAAGFRDAIAKDAVLKFAICVPSDDMVGPAFSATLAAALKRLEIEAQDCAVIADFSNSDFSDPTLVAPIINGALEQLQDFGSWQYVIFQGTHYPETNPASPGSIYSWPRNEWEAWKQAVKFDPSTAENMMFGDYAADCAKINFGAGGGVAIKHYRYTTESSWLVVRGAKTGTDKVVMQDVCEKILSSGQFAGAGFSTADSYIYHTAKDQDGPGNSSTWRQVNTTHHITRVVVDLGVVRGVQIVRQPIEHEDAQMPLLNE